MPKIAMIGAGSVIFTKTLMNDIMATPDLQGSEFALMDPAEGRLLKMEAFAKDVIRENKLPTKVWATTDRRKALDGADYVVIMIQVGGMDAFQADYEIPLKYGVDQCIGDTQSAGAIFRALRTIPVLISIASDVKELCPNAIMLNYANPMAANCWALGTVPGLQFVGLCHGVQTTMDLIAGYVGVPKGEIDYIAAGINHMAWFLKLEKDGKDLYPTLREKFEKPEYYINEKVRGEVFRQFGYFMTESTGHLAEYVPWFRSSRKALDLYCDEPGFGGESGAYYAFSKYVADKYTGTELLADEPITLPSRSIEYGSYVIEALETGRRFRLNGNVINGGMITNLPADCCAEGPIYVDRLGLHKTIVGDLPPQCAALNMTNINVQRLTVEAALTGDPEYIVHACALDPLTGAVLTLKEIREMAAEMLEAEKQWMPQFADKAIRPTPTVRIPANVERAEVPVDPALAIMARFGELGQ